MKNNSTVRFVAHLILGLAALGSTPAADVRGEANKYLYPVDQNGKWGFNIVIEPRFGYGFAFNEGLAWVEGSATMGFIDKTGKVVVFSPNDTYCRRFRDGLARTMPIPPRPMPQLIRAAQVALSGRQSQKQRIRNVFFRRRYQKYPITASERSI